MLGDKRDRLGIEKEIGERENKGDWIEIRNWEENWGGKNKGLEIGKKTGERDILLKD